MSECVNCSSTDTEMKRGLDDHFRKHCSDCDHVGGPYVSDYKHETDDTTQPSLGEFS
jgi:hypothetical protein